MRKLLTSLMMLLFAVNVFAQSGNDKISYQAVVRNAQNQLVSNKTVDVTVNIFNGDATTAAYTEMQTTTTNLNGLISLLIGPDGDNAAWNSIQWNHARIETTVTLNGTSLGSLAMPLTAVPYALYAKELDLNAQVVQQLYNVISADSALLQQHIDTTSAHIRELLEQLELHSDHIDTILLNHQQIMNYITSLEQVIITGDAMNLAQLLAAIALLKTNLEHLRDSVKTNITNIAINAAKEQADSALLGGRLDAIENAGYITRDVDDLTNYTTTAELQNIYATKAKVKQDSIDLGVRIDAKADTSTVYTKGQIDDKLATKANTADVYTKTQTDINIHDTADVVRGEMNTKLATKADTSSVYTRTQTDINIHDTADIVRGEVNDKLAAKANIVDVYTKTQTDINIHDTADVVRGEMNTKLATKADTSSVYTRTQIDTKLSDTARYATKMALKDTAAVIRSLIPDAQVQSNWTQTTVSAVDYIKNKPSISDSISNYLTTNNYVTETVLANAIHDSIMNNAVNEFTEEIHNSIVARIITQVNDTITEALSHINSCEAVNACVISALADGTSAINQIIDTIATNETVNYLTTHGYVTETDVAATIHDSIENNISSQIHDSITDALSDYTIRSCGDVNGCLIVALASDFTTQLFVRNIISGYLNTNNYVTAADIPTKTSDLTNDSHFVSNENCEDLDICNLMATVNGLVNTVSNMQNTITDMQSTIDSLKGVIDDLGSTAPRLKVEGSGTAFSCTNNTRSTVYTTTITNANISDYTLSWKVNGTDSSSVHGNTLSCTFPSAGIYTVVCNATRAGYATLTDSVVVTLTVGAEPAISSTSVLGYTLTLAGVTNVSTISWGGDEGAEDIHGQTTAHHSYCAGTYTLMATSEDGCYLKLNETINAPVVNTSAATSVTTTEATFNGTLTNSDYVYTEKGFYYKRATDASYTQVDGTLSDSILTVELTGLSAGTTYHFYAYAIAEGCNTRITGNTLTFTTQAPIVTTDSASDITASFAKLSGIVSNYNNVTISSSGFDYKVTGSTNYTRVVGTFSDDTITAELTDLIYSTKYTYRAFAIYDNKTVYGDTLTFTTKTPTVTTGAASDITASSANLGGSAFNHDVTIVSIGFEYKETDSTDYIQVVGTLTDDTLTAELTGLTSSTEYTYRAFMTYGNNTVYGDPLTFTTITPSITTGAATDVTTSSVKLGGSVFNHDNLTIASIGFEYKKTGGTDYTQVVGTLTDDTLTAELTGITSSTECTYRAFMTFEDKTIYGDTNTFTTLSIVACSGHSAINSNETSTGSAGNYTVTSVKDGENNTYAVVSIGNQCWMAENMRTTAYTKANPSGTLTWSTTAAESSNDRFYYYPYEDENNVATYGLLYNWYAATDNESSNDNPNVQGICPNGWHIPTESEFSTMVTATGATNAAGKLTAGLWGEYGSGAEPGNTDYPQRNSSGFSALPAGFFGDGIHYPLGYFARFWSSSEDGNSLALAYILNNVTIPPSNYEEGQSVRCLRNDIAPTAITGAFSAVTTLSATLSGSITNPDYMPITSKGIEYKVTGSPTYTTVAVTGFENSFSIDLSNLDFGTEYTYRAFVTYDGKTVYGDELTFTTQSPTVTTDWASAVMSMSATLNGSVNNPDNLQITSRGFEFRDLCSTSYITEISPDTDNSFTAGLTKLLTPRQYFYRAFATFGSKTVYGNEVTFTTKAESTSGTACQVTSIRPNEIGSGDRIYTVRDGQGNRYSVVKIGNQCWMAENMRATAYTKAHPSGTLTLSPSWADDNEGFYYYPGGLECNVATYGLLYNWYAATDNRSYENNNNQNVQGICPEGWHIPNESEFSTMLTAAGATNAAGKLTAGLWGEYGSGAEPGNYSYSERNSSGFSALPAGWFLSGYDIGVYYITYFWTSHDSGGKLQLMDSSPNATMIYESYQSGGSVRCIRDE